MSDTAYYRSRAVDCRQLAKRHGMEAYATALRALALDYERAAERMTDHDRRVAEWTLQLVREQERLIAQQRRALAQLEDGGEPTDLVAEVIDELETQLSDHREELAYVMQALSSQHARLAECVAPWRPRRKSIGSEAMNALSRVSSIGR